MKRPRKIVWLAAAAAAASVLALAACDQFQADPLVFTVVDGVAVTRTCLDLAVTRIEIEVADDDLETDEVLWTAQGRADLPAGAEFSFGQLPAGLTADVPFREEFFDGNIYVRMSVSHVEGGSWRTFSPIEAGSLTEGEWLDGRGDPTSVPCTQQECAPGWACHNNWPDPTGRPTELEPTFVPTPLPTP